MSALAEWIGYALMCLGAVAALAGVVFLVTLLVWEQWKRAHGLTTIYAALKSARDRVEEIDDAKRYRWLRTKAYWLEHRPRPFVVIGSTLADACPLMAGEMDEAIDAAMDAPNHGSAETAGPDLMKKAPASGQSSPRTEGEVKHGA